jgi:hypothetical protein
VRPETFFSHEKFRWLKFALISCALLILSYVITKPDRGAHGGSVYGYVVGGLCTIAIIYLMWFGIRKRSYRSHRTTVKGWLSAHVWIGLLLLIAVPLHSGFEMGLNIHGLTYFLMVVIVVSGIWGAVNYKTLAPQIESHRGAGNFKSLIEQIYAQSKALDDLSLGKSDLFLRFRDSIEPKWPLSLWQILCLRPEDSQKNAQSQIASLPQIEKSDAITSLQIASKKREIIALVAREAKTGIKLKVWLLLHLPLSFALLIAVMTHIVVVLVYRG